MSSKTKGVLRVSHDRSTPIGRQDSLTADRLGNLSRRDFIRFNLALLALAGTASCRWPDDLPDERSTLRLMRAEDLLALTFEWRNLRIQHRGRQPARLVRIRENQEALLIVGFPGQHIFEQAYPGSTASGSIVLPARARIARPSRLVFKLPPERPYINLTFDGLLGWSDWNPVWPEADRKEQTPAAAAEPSRVAMPYGLALSPEDAARWHHATHPVTHDGRTELWHTRLLPQDSRQPLTVKILQPEPVAGDMTDITTALTERDREALAGRSARARTLILSPMGGWLDVRGRWESGAPSARWQQRVTAGQDQQVVIERQEGFLYPFGQRAALISVTERQLVKVRATPSPEALLRQRDFIVIKQPEAAYTHGQMALSRMTALGLVTPPLYDARRRYDDQGVFWIETGPGQAFPFRFRARDWAERPLFLEAPALFVADADRLPAARALYEQDDNDPRRKAPLHGQAAAVVMFDSAVEGDTDRWGVPLENPRSVGDTTVYLLQIEFAGTVRTGPDAGPPFDCRTKRMEVQLPSLEPYLDEADNRGWFTLVDPDPPENRGEVFARAWDGDKIPMYFDRQADRSGGVAAPSFDVDGLSRVRGPVGDASREGPMYANGQFDPDRYFNPEHANLLGGFPLSRLLLADSGTKSPAVPAIHFSLSPKPLPKEADQNARPQWEAGLGLSWRIVLQKYDIGPAHFIPDLDKQKRSKARLDIEARLTKTLGKPPAPEDQPSEADQDEAGGGARPVGKEKRPDKSAPSSVSWQVSGKISDFAIGLDTGPLGHISIGFAHLGVTLGPPPPDKKKKPTPEDQKKEAAKTEKKKKLAAKIDYQMSEIKAKGILLFLIKLIQMAADLPRIPDVDLGPPPSSAPSKLADVGDADLSVRVGPMALPTPPGNGWASSKSPTWPSRWGWACISCPAS